MKFEFDTALDHLAGDTGSNDDYQKVSNLLNDNPSIMQLSKFNVNISDGQDIHIGDCIFNEWNEAAIRELIKNAKKIKQEEYEYNVRVRLWRILQAKQVDLKNELTKKFKSELEKVKDQLKLSDADSNYAYEMAWAKIRYKKEFHKAIVECRPIPLTNQIKLELTRLKKDLKLKDEELEVLEREVFLDLNLPLIERPDFSELETCLQECRWQEADIMTKKLMLNLTDSDSIINAIRSISCGDIRMINQLWLDNSFERFGFSVQIRIYESIGCNEVKWSKIVGWRNPDMLERIREIRGKSLLSWIPYSQLQFDLNAPEGHLPVLGKNGYGSSGKLPLLEQISEKLRKCNIQ